MNIFQKYHSSGYTGQFLGQQPETKIPGRIGCVYPTALNPAGFAVLWTGVKDWPNRCLDPDDFDLYAQHNSGLCLKTEYFPFIDIDLEDTDLVHQVASLVTDELGMGMVRLREGTNRVGIVFKTEEPFKSLPSVLFSRQYELVEGKPKAKIEQVEFLGKGRQFVAEGIHPSGNRYNIVNFMPAIELPTITEDQMLKVRSEIEKLVPLDAMIEPHPTHNKTSMHCSNRIDLYEDFVLLTDIGPATVGDVLKNPDRYKYCRDPYEPDYGNGNNRIARIYGDKIYSFAHGGITYFLHDFSRIRPFLDKLDLGTRPAVGGIANHPDGTVVSCPFLCSYNPYEE